MTGRSRTLALITFVAIGLAGCGDDDEAQDPPNKAVRSAALGEALILQSDEGQKLRVTVTGVQDPVKQHPFEDARISGRFVGVHLRITNEGEITVRESPWSGSRLTTSMGAERPTRRLKRGSCLRARRRVISPGVTERVCMPFLVEKNARLRKFRYTPGGGFSRYAGVWDLRP